MRRTKATIVGTPQMREDMGEPALFLVLLQYILCTQMSARFEDLHTLVSQLSHEDW